MLLSLPSTMPGPLGSAMMTVHALFPGVRLGAIAEEVTVMINNEIRTHIWYQVHESYVNQWEVIVRTPARDLQGRTCTLTEMVQLEPAYREPSFLESVPMGFHHVIGTGGYP